MKYMNRLLLTQTLEINPAKQAKQITLQINFSLHRHSHRCLANLVISD